MNIAKINPCDIANGPGVRVSVFVSGCRRHCPGCHNEQAWDFGYGEPYTPKTEEYILKLLEPDYIDGITILGGEPLEPENLEELLALVWRVHEKTGKSVWMYTGYTFETLLNAEDEDGFMRFRLAASADVLVDGEYREDERDITLKYRGSRNQRIIDMQKTKVVLTMMLDEELPVLEAKPVLWKGEE
jgi:anaerobic ribonucleoside-triphosphate reductase activating protein